jgi:hypothetical protein
LRSCSCCSISALCLLSKNDSLWCECSSIWPIYIHIYIYIHISMFHYGGCVDLSSSEWKLATARIPAWGGLRACVVSSPPPFPALFAHAPPVLPLVRPRWRPIGRPWLQQQQEGGGQKKSRKMSMWKEW